MSERGIDQRLVARVQQGDKTAFDLLVRKYQHKVAKLVARYVRDRSEAEDVAQEAFLKAYRAIAGFRGESAFYTWLYRIAVNTAKNYLDSQGRRPPNSDSCTMSSARCTRSSVSARPVLRTTARLSRRPIPGRGRSPPR